MAGLSKRSTVFAVAAVLGAAAAVSRADTVVKTSGQTLTGLVVAESAADVTLQTNVGELVVRTKIARAEIAAIRKAPAAAHRYCRLPIHGEIGTDVKAEWLAAALRQAEGFGANYLVLDVDSPGGEIGEMVKILDLLEKQRQFTLVAHVHRGMSAAAMIALVCPTVVMDKRAAIGAAVPWQFGPTGTPADIEAKFFSAYRAICQTAAAHGGHSPLLARGMMEMDLVLSTVRTGRGVEVVEGAPAGGDVLKRKGEILCLPAADAVTCGLAAGTAETADDLGRVLGVSDWAAVGEAVWAHLEARPAAAKADADRRREAAAADAMAAQLAAVEARIPALVTAKEAAAKRAAALPLEEQAEEKKVDPALSPAARDKKILDLRARYEGLVAEARNALAAADAELQQLTKARGALIERLGR